MEINHYNTRARLINELTRGMELARQLRAKMGPEYSPQTRQVLLEQIISSYEKALFILRGGAPSKQPHQLALVASPLLPNSPSSIMGGDQTPRSNSPQDGKQGSFKRKSASTWTNQVKLDPENGLEDGPPYDGYNWRKYGQKDILGAKYPRSYYKCTYRSIQDCWATKQVQRSDEDPSVVNITYRGKHTCNEVRRSKSAPTVTLPAKQEPKQDDQKIEEYQQDSSSMVSSFQATLLPIEIADMQSMGSCYPSSAAAQGCLKIESPPFYGDFPTCLISPSTTSDSNYFSTMSPSKMDTFENVQHQQRYFEGGIGDIVLGATSSTNNDPGFLA